VGLNTECCIYGGRLEATVLKERAEGLKKESIKVRRGGGARGHCQPGGGSSEGSVAFLSSAASHAQALLYAAPSHSVRLVSGYRP
jgi:hypothetical protein